MKNSTKKIGNSLLGYNKNQAREYLEELDEIHNKRLRKVRDKITNYKEESNNLTNELEELRLEMETQLKSEEFMEFSLEILQDWKALFEKETLNRVEDINCMAKQQEDILNEKIEEFDNGIKLMQGQLDILLKSVLKKNESLIENVKTYIDKKAYKDLGSKLIQDGENEEIIQETNCMFDDSSLEKDMLTNDDSKDVRCDCEEVNNEVSEDTKDEDEAIKPRGFWGDEIEEEINNLDPQKNEKSIDGKNDLYASDVTVSNTVKGISIDRDNQADSENKIMQGSKAISSDINQIRGKYLVGKIVGEDLYDSNNKLIIVKGSIITSEIIELAENEGKLAELIVNMQLPNMAI